MPRTRLSIASCPSTTAPNSLPLERLVADIDAALVPQDPGALLRVTGDPLQIAHLPLEGEHPLDALMGFVAPPSWLAVGVHCRGRAHPLAPDALTDDHDDCTATASGFGISEATPVVITTLVDRSGRGAGLMRHGSTATRFDDAPEGIVGDACRRALGLPTPAPPRSTAELWLRMWLDRVVETVAFADEPDRWHTWDAITALHPAAPGSLLGLPVRQSPDGSRAPVVGSPSLADPEALGQATLMLAEARSWELLRREPELVDIGGPPLSRELADWMDDGMFARVLLSELASLSLLAKTAHSLLPFPLLEEINVAVVAAGLRWFDMAEAI